MYTLRTYENTRIEDNKAPSCLGQAQLTATVEITIGTVAAQERGVLGISEPVARLTRLIEGGVDVEAFAHKSRSRRDRPAKPTKSSNVADPKSSGRKRTRKDSV